MPEPSDAVPPLPSDAIGQQLASARAELDALEQAVDALPEIFEAKFRQGVAAVVETNRQLVAQQALLQRECAALPPASRRRVWAWPTIQLPRLQLPGLSGRHLATVGLVAAGVGLLAWGATRWLQPGPSLPARRATPAPVRPLTVAGGSTLVLRAQDTSWVEVQDLNTREVLLIGLLEPGQERQIRLRQGLRIRSGRPDLLSIQIDAGPPQPFGDDLGLGWRTFKKAGA